MTPDGLVYRHVKHTHWLASGHVLKRRPYHAPDLCEAYNCKWCPSSGPSPHILKGGQDFWTQYGFFPCTNAVGAWSGDRVVAFFRFNIAFDTDTRSWYTVGEPGDRVLVACGTWVDGSLRKRGIGKKLWQIALSRWSPNKLEVVAVSRGGARLVNAIRKAHPEIQMTGHGWEYQRLTGERGCA